MPLSALPWMQKSSVVLAVWDIVGTCADQAWAKDILQEDELATVLLGTVVRLWNNYSDEDRVTTAVFEVDPSPKLFSSFA